MITFKQATAGTLVDYSNPHVKSWYRYTHSEFEHMTATNADGTPMRYRRNGATKTWKTRPGHFRIPVKRGLYEYGYITHENAHEFRVERQPRVTDGS